MKKSRDSSTHPSHVSGHCLTNVDTDPRHRQTHRHTWHCPEHQHRDVRLQQLREPDHEEGDEEQHPRHYDGHLPEYEYKEGILSFITTFQ